MQTTDLTSIVKKYHCIGKNIIATSITKHSDSSFQVKLKEQNKTFIVDVGLEIYCSCNKNERADRKTCVHIAWCMNKLCKKELSDEIIAQVSLEYQELLSLDPPSEFPVIHTENERFHNKIINHKNFNVENDWFADVKKSKKSCTCAGCLKKGAINTGDLHLHIKGLFYVAKDDKVVSSTLRFCPIRKCVQEIKSSFHNVQSLVIMTVKIEPGLVLDVEERAHLQLERFTVIDLAQLDL